MKTNKELYYSEMQKEDPSIVYADAYIKELENKVGSLISDIQFFYFSVKILISTTNSACTIHYFHICFILSLTLLLKYV